MFANACTTTQVFSVESTFSALMSGAVKTIEAIYNFYKELRNQVEENTITCESSTEIHVSQYFKTKIQKYVMALK